MSPRWSGPRSDGKGHRIPQRMFPRGGGTPLPHQPIAAPPAYVWPLVPGGLVGVAKWYVKVLDKELNQTDDAGNHKWTGSQRQYIQTLKAKWFQRAMGADAGYILHGTFPRGMHPTMRDVMTERHRQQAMDDGTYMSNAEHKRRRTWALSYRARQEIVKRWAAQAKATGPVPGKVKKKPGHYDEDKGGD